MDDIDETLERLRKRGAQLVGEVVQYKDACKRNAVDVSSMTGGQH